MKNTRQLGIWMDHSIASLIEFTVKPFEVQTILYEFPLEKKNTSLTKKYEVKTRSNKAALNKFYNKIGRAIVKYDKVVLFGPFDAKIEFFDFLSEDERFLKLKIEIKDADNMDVNQQHHFIKEYFTQELYSGICY
ncbi:MAG: stalled ribosome rescue protein Dom34 [Flavobacterium sp.]|jgi:stalled ribosome rescue protein Dom34